VFNNIEVLVRKCFKLLVEEERYGNGILLGLDYIINGTELYDMIDAATSPGDMEAMNAYFALQDIANEYPEFLYVQADSLDEGFVLLEKRAELWNCTEDSRKEEIHEKLHEIVTGCRIN
jgi:hypothetical protein